MRLHWRDALWLAMCLTGLGLLVTDLFEEGL